MVTKIESKWIERIKIKLLELLPGIDIKDVQIQHVTINNQSNVTELQVSVKNKLVAKLKIIQRHDETFVSKELVP